MFKIETKGVTPEMIQKELSQLPERIDNLKFEIGNSIATAIKQDVVKRIPTGPGWFNIYKKAIDVSFDGNNEWIVAGEKDVPITAVDAERTLLFFSGDDEASAVLTAYNPWPIDMVPGINAIYSSKVTLRPGSIPEVEARRKQILTKVGEVKSNLISAGFTPTPDELPKYGKGAMADLAFMAQRLENGLGDLPRVPHWGPAADNISATIETTLKSVNSRFESILRGSTSSKPQTLTSKLKSMLSSAVRKSPQK